MPVRLALTRLELIDPSARRRSRSALDLIELGAVAFPDGARPYRAVPRADYRRWLAAISSITGRHRIEPIAECCAARAARYGTLRSAGALSRL